MFDIHKFRSCAEASQSLILSRTDSLGDVTLTLPVTGVLKTAYPRLRLIFLGSDYTREVITSCIHVDEFWSWDQVKKKEYIEFKNLIKSSQAFGIIHIFPRLEIAWAFKKLELNFRLGTSRRWYHWLTCTNRIALSRRHSERHEAQLNIDLLAQFIPQKLSQLPLEKLANFYGLQPPKLDSEWQKALDPERPIWIIHAHSKGSARNYPIKNWIKLAQALLADYQVVLTGTETERSVLQPLCDALQGRVVNLIGRLGLRQLLALIGCCTGVIAASTGPLHLAAALGRGAIGLYPPIKPVHAARWGPLGCHAHAIEAAQRCTSCKAEQGSCPCMETIAVHNILEKVHQVTDQLSAKIT